MGCTGAAHRAWAACVTWSSDGRNWAKLLAALLLFEVIANWAIVWLIPYTEIDWVAYMQEVAGVVEHGELDYMQLRGDTGPLVYPAGFVYLFTALYWLTNRGSNILRAQIVFAVLHVAFAAVVFTAYRGVRGSKVGDRPWVWLALCASRRIHSIFVLRLFNDCWAMLALWLAVVAMQRNRWTWACIVFSLGVSVKMNVLLAAPGLAILLAWRLGVAGALVRIAAMVGLQAVLGAPFLWHHAAHYVGKAFELSRVFQYKWSVNWHLVSEPVFLHPRFAQALLALHLIALLMFAHWKWSRTSLWSLFWQTLRNVGHEGDNIPSEYIMRLIWTSNFIGIVFSRTLHYQFYVWYFHSIPFLLASTPFPGYVCVALMAVIELVWNVYPPRAIMSLLLHVCHVILLVGLWLGNAKQDTYPSTPKRA